MYASFHAGYRVQFTKKTSKALCVEKGELVRDMPDHIRSPLHVAFLAVALRCIQQHQSKHLHEIVTFPSTVEVCSKSSILFDGVSKSTTNWFVEIEREADLLFNNRTLPTTGVVEDNSDYCGIVIQDPTKMEEPPEEDEPFLAEMCKPLCGWKGDTKQERAKALMLTRKDVFCILL